MSRSRCASACLAREAVSAATRSWSAWALATAAARVASARLMAISRSALAVATSASRLMRATSGRPMLVVYSFLSRTSLMVNFFFQAEDGIRDADVTGVQTCALPIFLDRDVRRALRPWLRGQAFRPTSSIQSAFQRRFAAERTRLSALEEFGRIVSTPRFLLC